MFIWMDACLPAHVCHTCEYVCEYFLYTWSKHTVAHSLFRIHVVADISHMYACRSVCAFTLETWHLDIEYHTFTSLN